jgi:hypothetical protein
MRGAAAQTAEAAEMAASVQAMVLPVRFMLSSEGLSFVLAELFYQNVRPVANRQHAVARKMIGRGFLSWVGRDRATALPLLPCV